MNAHHMAKDTYASPAAPTRTPRGVEYEAFARVTRKLSAASATNDGAGFRALAAAVHENRRLWTTLAADVADTGNGLPAPLRARLFYLNDFTRAQSSRVLDGSTTAAALIEVNMAVMRGLRGDGQGTGTE